MRARFFLVPALALLCAAAPPCEARGHDDPWLSDTHLRYLGLDVGLGYRGYQLFPGVDTILWSYLGGGYEWLEYYREPDGTLIAPGALGGRNPVYTRIEGLGKVGIAQGLAWNQDTGRNLLELFLFYKSRYDANQASMAGIPGSVFQNTLLFGLTLDAVGGNLDHKVRSGIGAEASAEWGPGWFFNTLAGSADFIRFNGNVKAFLPLFDIAPDRPVNLLNAYFAENLSVDYAIGFGFPVPLSIRQSFGGRNPQTGLGFAVRGVSWGSMDTDFKAVNNLELRVNLPALLIPDVVPGIILFLDSGYYWQVGEAGIPVPAPHGLVASTGLGVFLDFLDQLTGALYLDYRLDDVNPNSGRWSLAAEGALHF